MRRFFLLVVVLLSVPPLAAADEGPCDGGGLGETWGFDLFTPASRKYKVDAFTKRNMIYVVLCGGYMSFELKMSDWPSPEPTAHPYNAERVEEFTVAPGGYSGYTFHYWHPEGLDEVQLDNLNRSVIVADDEPPPGGDDPPPEEWSDPGSPIVLDLGGNGYRLTSAEMGVRFDIDADGVPDQVAWTSAGSDEAFLALDRNGNGYVDDGAELFGNATPLDWSGGPRAWNGFQALASFDAVQDGGNANGLIDSGDAVYGQLLLWNDLDHNGRSDPGEVLTLSASGVTVMTVETTVTNRRDRFGNVFWLRAPYLYLGERGHVVTRQAYDIVFQVLR